jgi:hypothetical protein
MPALSTIPPNEGSYQFVLQFDRFVAVPGETHPLRYQGYEESTESIGCALPGMPLRHTIFLRHRTTRDRAIRDGWTDISERWHAMVLDARPKISTLAQRSVMGALTEEWQTKSAIVSTAGIVDSEWRTTIKLLEERRLVECNIGPRQKKGASNRGYRYRRGVDYERAVDVVEV